MTDMFLTREGVSAQLCSDCIFLTNRMSSPYVTKLQEPHILSITSATGVIRLLCYFFKQPGLYDVKM